MKELIEGPMPFPLPVLHVVYRRIDDSIFLE